MKCFLLSAALLTAVIGGLRAQQLQPADFKCDLGLNAGFSPNTVPQGPSALYKGSQGSVNGFASLCVHFNIYEKWQIGLELGATQWKSSGTSALTDNFGQALQPQKVTYIIADPAITFCAQLNRIVPFYSKYKKYNKANFYYGLSFGLVPTVNDGAIGYSTYKQSPDPQYQYVSKYDYGNGLGFMGGVQVGYSYYFFPDFGINVELAGRFAYVGTSETRYSHENSQYDLFYIPVTVGVRYRF